MHTQAASNTTTNLFSLPMYDLHRADTVALGGVLKELFAARGIIATHVWPPPDLLTHWQEDALLLSQTCGYPLVTQLDKVQTVGCFHYQAPGCEGIGYCSFLVAREEESGKTLEDFRGQRAVCNAIESQSGYNALRKMVAALSGGKRFFAAVEFSGSHRQSLVALQQDRADIAAIDCVTWALLQRHQPDLLEGLTIIGQSPLTPGLPLITSASTSAANLALLRESLQQLVSDAQYHDVCAAALIGGFAAVTREDYALLLEWRDDAAAHGVVDL
ncbi:ABC-type phosphate/phosphonate transport system, substrate-binding protein [Kosakonia sacchari]|nr:ABC-type phosphate/phosphonate transport system, substrate-binding protein [Kosakonia sacchari]